MLNNPEKERLRLHIAERFKDRLAELGLTKPQACEKAYEMGFDKFPKWSLIHLPDNGMPGVYNLSLIEVVLEVPAGYLTAGFVHGQEE